MKDICIGIIGAGKFSHRHMQAIEKVDHIHVKAACRTNATALEKFCKKYNLTGYSNYQELIENPEINAVLISTPHHLHKEIAISACQAGKHLLVEKPLAHKIEDSRTIVREADRAGVVLMVGHTTRYTRAYQAVLRCLMDDDLGDITQAVSFSNYFWMGPDRKVWHLNPEMGGGYLLTLGIHQLDAQIGLVGERVMSVRASLSNDYHSFKIDDRGSIWLTYENGIIGALIYNGYTHGVPKVATEIYCRSGAVKLDTREGNFLCRQDAWELISSAQETDWLDDALIREWEDFRDAILTDRRPIVDGETALHTMEVIAAAFESSRKNEEVWI